MPELSVYQTRREELKQRYLSAAEGAPQSVNTGGVDHLALICSDLGMTIRFYTEVLGMRLTKVMANRDEPHVYPYLSRYGRW